MVPVLVCVLKRERKQLRLSVDLEIDLGTRPVMVDSSG